MACKKPWPTGFDSYSHRAKGTDVRFRVVQQYGADTGRLIGAVIRIVDDVQDIGLP